MSARTRLRALIEELEARYAALDEVADSYDERRSADFRSVITRKHQDDENSLVKKTECLENAVSTLDALRSSIYTDSNQTRASLRSMVNARCLMSVKLPPEILAIIFEAACTNDGHSIRNWNDPIWRDRNAINLTCFHWRQVALRTPSLWNNIVTRTVQRQSGAIGSGNDHESQTGEMVPDLSLVSIFVDRAGTVPLNVTCKGDAAGKNWRAIQPHIARALSCSIRSLDITLPTLPQPSGIFSESSLVPKLRYLWLDWENVRASDPTDRYIDLSEAISLVGLSISHRSRSTQYLHLKLPGVCPLTFLKLNGRFPISHVISSVACCASSVETLNLYINGAGSGIQDAPVLTKLQLNRLRHLRVMIQFSSILMGAMEAPNLQSLALRSSSSLKTEFWTHCPHPLSDTQQFPVLAHLYVAPQTILEDLLMPYLVAHPELTTVASVSFAFARRLLLTDNPESDTLLLPNLRNVMIHDLSTDHEAATSALRGLALRLQDMSAAGPKCRIHSPRPDLQFLAEEFPEYIHIYDPSDAYLEFMKMKELL